MSVQPTFLHRLFAGAVENVFFGELGLVNPPVVDYVVDMLLRFVRMDVVHRMRTPRGQQLTEVASMLAEARGRVGSARRTAYQHIGDFTLFWGGMYPESLRELQCADSLDYFLNYCKCGQQAYFLASSMDYYGSNSDPSSDVLHAMSCKFQMITYGLREVRREVERIDEGEHFILL